MRNSDKFKKDKYVLITGGSKGLGYELAKLFAQEKYNLILVARGESELVRVSKELEENYNIKCHPLVYDLSNMTEIDKLYQEIKEKKLEVSILINNAGFGHWWKFDEMDANKQIKMLNLNITGLSHLTRLFVKDMINYDFGKVLNVSSIASFGPIPFVSTYAASKSYVTNFSRALDYELKNKNIRVSVLCSPDFVSGFQEGSGNPDLIPTGPYIGTAEGIARVAFKKFMNNRKVITPYSLFGKTAMYFEKYLIPDVILIPFKKWVVDKDYLKK